MRSYRQTAWTSEFCFFKKSRLKQSCRKQCCFSRLHFESQEALLWQVGIAGVQLLFRYCSSPWLKFTQKLGEKSGSKVARCDPLMLGESPAILISWISAYWLLLEHCKAGREEARTPFCLQAELDDWGRWEEGSPLSISSVYPCWYSGSIWSSPFLQKAERKTESCLCVCNACLYKNGHQRQSQVLY